MVNAAADQKITLPPPVIISWRAAIAGDDRLARRRHSSVKGPNAAAEAHSVGADF